jgi:hypothetical protein
MNQSPPDILSAEWAWPNFRRDVFQLLAWGYQLKEAEIRQRHLEEDITGLIRQGINEKLNEDLPPRFRCYSAKNEDPVDDGILGKDRPRVDILIENGGSLPRKRYRLEAKRCARNQNPIGWYAQGIVSFVEQRYAKDAPEAGVIGLVQSDTVKRWKSQLSVKITKDVSLASQSTLVDVTLTPDLIEMSYSLHERSDGSSITLYHAFLDCNS